MYYSKMANFHYFLVIWGKGTAFIGAIVRNGNPLGIPNWDGQLNRYFLQYSSCGNGKERQLFLNGLSSFFQSCWLFFFCFVFFSSEARILVYVTVLGILL